MPFPEAASNEELARILAGITVPVLSLAGMRDGVISPQSALRAAAAVPHSKTVLFEDEGHFVADERPHRLVREVKVFLDELADYESNGGHWR
jgi:pimeloyl-ACP methyl ester carboxylesterase